MKAKMIKAAKGLAGSLEYSFMPWNYAADELLVLCMHSTPKRFMASFEHIIQFLLRKFKPIQPSDLEAYFRGNMKDGPYLLFSFDDGLKNNLEAASMLSKYNMAALFFVVPDFISAIKPEQYYREHIRQHIEPWFVNGPEDLTPMSIADLKSLIADGHEIGSHTMTHLLRASHTELAEQREIEDSRKWLEEKLQKPVRTFCSPINTNLSISRNGKRLIKEHYTYHFSTFPAENHISKNPLLIFRRNIEVDWSMGGIKFALGKKDLKRWKEEIQNFINL
jgi:peptidoglycan/xylan/chitin deacetylase (PgdA/CDA1 family)